MVLFNLGSRVGEACALTWDAVDFSRSKVTIDKSLNRYRKKEYGFTLAVESTKSRKGIRTITVNEAVINALMKQRQLQMQNLCPAGRILRVDDYGRVIGEIDNLVFTQANGNAWYEPAIISLIHRIVKKQNDFAEKENGKKLEYFTPHQIRHPYVKHKTKSFLRNSRVFKADFCAPSHSLCTEVFHFPDNINLISGVNIHTFNQCVSQGGI